MKVVGSFRGGAQAQAIRSERALGGVAVAFRRQVVGFVEHEHGDAAKVAGVEGNIRVEVQGGLRVKVEFQVGIAARFYPRQKPVQQPGKVNGQAAQHLALFIQDKLDLRKSRLDSPL